MPYCPLGNVLLSTMQRVAVHYAMYCRLLSSVLLSTEQLPLGHDCLRICMINQSHSCASKAWLSCSWEGVTAAQLFQDHHSSNHSHLPRLVPSAAPLFAGVSPSPASPAPFCRNPHRSQDLVCNSLVAWLSVLQLSDDVNNCTHTLVLQQTYLWHPFFSPKFHTFWVVFNAAKGAVRCMT